MALNISKVNCVHNGKAYHAFDGIGNRITGWTGGSGMDKARIWQQYCFQTNDNFKRSNIWPPSEFYGAFEGPPSTAVTAYDPLFNRVQNYTAGVGLIEDVPGENKNLRRLSLPIHFDVLSTLPAQVRALQPYKLNVVEGVTSLTTDARSTQSAYKAPSSVDFNINGDMFRATDEFICSIDGQGVIQDVAPTAGMTFIGATTKEAYFYSASARMYYAFSGGRDLTKKDVFNKFKNVEAGRWDFINQEVMFKCLYNGDNVICRIDGDVLGEAYPPPKTIYSDKSDFKIGSAAAGLIFQGPVRAAVHRYVFSDYMLGDVLINKGRWDRESRDGFEARDYGWAYVTRSTQPPAGAVDGWTHNAFELQTAMLGVGEDSDCRFEWEVTFAWTDVLEALYFQNEYVTVNMQAETVTQGGLVVSDVTHVFLYKECFTRAVNSGYYTLQFQSNGGLGNRERLKIWSDGPIALTELTMYAKNITVRRSAPIHSQIDVSLLKEF